MTRAKLNGKWETGLTCFGETLSDFRANPNEKDAVFETIIIVQFGQNRELMAVHNKEYFASPLWKTYEAIGTVKVKHFENDTLWTPNYAADAKNYALDYLVEIGKAMFIEELGLYFAV